MHHHDVLTHQGWPASTVRGWGMAVSLLGCFLCNADAQSQQSANDRVNLPVLTQAEQIRQLTPEQANRGYPVHIRGVITYYHPGIQRSPAEVIPPDLFVQDSTAGIWVNVPLPPPALKTGQFIDLEGDTEAPDFAPQIGKPRWHIIGEAPLPKPRRVSLEKMLSTSEDSQWVETEGIVRQARTDDSSLILEVAVVGGRLLVQIPRPDQTVPDGLVDAEIRVRGVCGALFNEKYQLIGVTIYVPSLDQLDIIKPAPADRFEVYVRPISSVQRFSPNETAGHRIRVQGTVSFQEPGRRIYIFDGTNGLRVKTDQSIALKPGDRVDVVGFPRISDFEFCLEDAMVRIIGTATPPLPRLVTAEQILQGNHDCLLVSVEGWLLDKTILPGRQTLVLKSAGTTFNASLEEREIDPRFINLRTGSLLRITGICLVKNDESEKTQSFSIALRSADEIVVTRQSPWWTVGKALTAFGLLAFVVLMVLLWVAALRRRVKSQTDLIVQRLEHERALEQRYQYLVENANDIIFTIDTKGTILSVNKAVERVFGYTQKEAQGNPAVQFFAPESRGQVAEAIECASCGQPYPVHEFEIATKQGHGVLLDVNLQAIQEGGKTVGILGVARDITERKRVEREILRAKEMAEAASRAKSDFVASMSHELRTPLTAIIGYSEMLQEEAQETGQHGYFQDLAKIQAAGKHLLDLINDILDLSKIEAGKMQLYPERFEVRSMIEETLDTAQPLAEKNGNRLVVALEEDLGWMLADQTKTRQVLFNLLSNACKFTKQGEIRLEARRQKKNGREWVQFRVEDSGIGMSPQQMGELFKPFTQADVSTSRKYGGTGLGLAISQRFCQLMNGELRVESVPGQGSTFTLELPAEAHGSKLPIERQIPQPVSSSAINSTAHSTFGGSETVDRKAGLFLVIDDDASARELMSRSLEKQGCRVALASSGWEGLRKAREIHPSAIILDVLMPGMDGWETLSSLKTDRELCKIPVIMSTIVDDKNKGFVLGASDYLVKPIEPEHLARVLWKYRGEESCGEALVVDDDWLTRDMFKRVMEAMGWVVSEAENGRKALERVNEKLPDLILLDLLMPEMDGFEFLLQLRQQPSGQSIPVVVVTGKQLSEAERKWLEGSVQTTLQKGEASRESLLQQICDLARNSTGEVPPGEKAVPLA